MMMPATTNHILTPTEEHELLQRIAAGEINAFWPLFQQHRDYLLRCCSKWMNGNSTEAEDVLSQAMVKAWEKAQKYAGKIENFKSWLTTLTRNFWIDLMRRRSANQVEDIEVYGDRDELGLVSVEDTPAIALDRDEKKRVICGAIDELPTKMRETFILHFYEELSHQEISEKQHISYQNVCKRISQARAILVKELRRYFIEEEKTNTEVSITLVAIEPVVEETPLKNAGLEPIVDEPMTLSVAVGEVESVVVEESPEVVVSEQESESDFVAATSEALLVKPGKPLTRRSNSAIKTDDRLKNVKTLLFFSEEYNMANLSVREIVDNWLLIDPINLGEVGFKSDTKTAATAAGNYLGKDDSDQNADHIAIYTDPRNLPTAVASIFNHAQNRAGFHPANTSADKLAVAFDSYVKEIDKTPFLHFVENKSDKQTFESKDYNALIDRVVALYDGVSSEDKKKLKESLVDMAKSVFGQIKKSEDWKNMFSQATLDFTNYASPTFMLYYTSLYMFHSGTGKAEVSKQTFEVRATKYQVLPELIRVYAPKLAQLDNKSVDDWANDSTSPKQLNVKLCFEN